MLLGMTVEVYMEVGYERYPIISLSYLIQLIMPTEISQVGFINVCDLFKKICLQSKAAVCTN